MDPAPPQAIAALWRAAQRLRRDSGVSSPLPPLFFFTDPDRTPEPQRIAERLPRGCGVVFRAFGAPDAVARGRRLARIARDRGLTLLAGADPDLARRIGADGVHLPERSAVRAHALATAHPDWMLTIAAHTRTSLRRAVRLPVSAVFVSPVFDSRSASAGRPIGAAALRRWVAGSSVPVFALGGVEAESIQRLARSGLAGVAAVDALRGR